VAFTPITKGLTLQIPVSGTRNWASRLFTDTWDKISSHDHQGSGTGKQIAAAAIAPNTIVASNITKNLGEYQVDDTASIAAGAVTVDWDLGRIHVIDMTGQAANVAITLSNPVEGAHYRLQITSDSGGKVISFVTAIKWPQGENPTNGTSSEYYLSGDGNIDQVELYYDGANYLATWEVGLV